MKYLAILGRQPELSRAELEAQGAKVGEIYFANGVALAEVEGGNLRIERLGGVQKIGVLLGETPLEVLRKAPEGKITFGISEFREENGANSGEIARNDENSRNLVKNDDNSGEIARNGEKRAFLAKNGGDRGKDGLATNEALKWKRKLLQQGRSVRVVPNKTGVISTATSLHNGLSGRNPRKFEFLHFRGKWYQVTGVQDIDAYAERDQKRPARDAKIGMLPPKLAQVMINLAGALPPRSRILDPFCGTGVVLQEAILMDFRAYGTDFNPKMVEYARKNLEWLSDELEKAHQRAGGELGIEVGEGDARDFRWEGSIDAVVTEGYLGKPFGRIPTGVEVKKEISEIKVLTTRFLKNLATQIAKNTPVVMALPAWLRGNGEYLRLNMLDSIEGLGYNVENNAREGLIYHREGQIVARDIIILRKK